MNNWISVKEKLPEMSESVLINFEDKWVMLGQLKNRSMTRDAPVWCCFFEDGFKEVGKRMVTHWMPLPEEPK